MCIVPEKQFCVELIRMIELGYLFRKVTSVLLGHENEPIKGKTTLHVLCLIYIVLFYPVFIANLKLFSTVI